jgi:hypothetical protein
MRKVIETNDGVGLRGEKRWPLFFNLKRCLGSLVLVHVTISRAELKKRQTTEETRKLMGG